MREREENEKREGIGPSNCQDVVAHVLSPHLFTCHCCKKLTMLRNTCNRN